MGALILVVLLLAWVFKGIEYKGEDTSWHPQDGPTRRNDSNTDL